ncbi:MAG: hypothetical protein ACRDZR_00500 [Acidimicrobiales bacterium]
MLTILLALFSAVMVDNVVQHDPMVKNTTIDHFTYRGLEGGLNDLMSEINENPNEVACNSTSPPGGQCPVQKSFLAWRRVPDTKGTGVIPEWFAWTDPKFCFTEACPVSTTTAHVTDTPTATATPPKPVLYVKETVYGAAGVPGNYSYEESTLNLKPVNGFLTRIWWSTYEADDPALHGTTRTPPGCGYNYPAYRGPNTGATECSPVVFASGTQVYGPIYSNDSIYVTGTPTLGPVQTADPNCLFVYNTGRTTQFKTQRCVTKASQETKPRGSRTVTQTTATFATSNSGDSKHPLPTTDATLEQYAAYDGCVYTGPTTIEFDATDKMTVWSLGTPAKAATATTPACPSTHVTTNPAHPTPVTNTGTVPNKTYGDGVIFVKTAPTPCKAGANPFDDYTETKGTNGSAAQYTQAHNAYDYFGFQPYPETNCEGDAFVSDNPASGGISGQLTVASSNDVVITGTIKYQDCGSAFRSTYTHPCHFNATGTKTNDSLGLIAQNYVVVNHPVKQVCTKVGYTTSCTLTNATLASACRSTVLGTPTAALCDPSETSTTCPTNPTQRGTRKCLTIDAALLALHHSFTVDNEGLITRNGGVGGLDGTLKVFGSIDQKWRGAVGIVGTSGYVKDYDWNSIGAIVTPPHYLAPATNSWTVGSSAVLNESCPPAFGTPTTGVVTTTCRTTPG